MTVKSSRVPREIRPTKAQRGDSGLPSGKYKGIRMKLIAGPIQIIVFESHAAA
jgi:hypothetical protein